MITKTATTLQCPNGWQAELAQAIHDPAELLTLLNLPDSLLDAANRAAQQFSLRVPLAFIQRMRPADPDDPLLRQVLPLATEFDTVTGFNSDPVGDLAALASPGLIHKYYGRALLVTTGACAVHCRYCFRRHFPYSEHTLNDGHWSGIATYLTAHPDIQEIILSGGDPLSLSDARFTQLISRLDALPQLMTLRIHSRLPVVIPNRISTELLASLAATRLRVVMVLHINHPNELDEALVRSISALREHAHLLNQAVLLRGVNDQASTLIALSQRLFSAGVLPYYLHQLDPVAGAHHFDVPLDEGQRIMAEVRARLPGYLVPRFSQERPGDEAKHLIAY